MDKENTTSENEEDGSKQNDDLNYLESSLDSFPEDQKVYNIPKYLELLTFHRASFFRGVSDVENHQLIPSVGRDWLSGLEELRKAEEELLEKLKTRAAILLENKPEDDWEWLVLGQHFGMPTRLLDWTSNPLVALYFACANDFDSDGAVYLSEGLSKIDPRVFSNPLDIPANFYLVPRHISPRIAAQSAYFTVSNDPTKPLEVTHDYWDANSNETTESNMRVIIEGNVKQSFLYELRKIGIGPASLFPGLDGLAKQIAMETFYLREEKNEKIKLEEMKAFFAKHLGKYK